jgi:hypothetical protein
MKYLTVLAVALLLVGCGGQKTEPAKTEAPVTDSAAVVEVSFAKDIQPVFAQNCMPCHSGGADAKSPYVLTSYDGVMGKGKDTVANVIAAQPDASLLYTMLKDCKMPPAGPLAAATVDLVMKWISHGAKNN